MCEAHEGARVVLRARRMWTAHGGACVSFTCTLYMHAVHTRCAGTAGDRVFLTRLFHIDENIAQPYKKQKSTVLYK